MDCWQVWGGAFTPKPPFEVGKKRGNKIGFIYVKGPRLKTMSYRTLGFPEYGLTNASILSLAKPLTATPKGVIKMSNKIDMYLCKMQC